MNKFKFLFFSIIGILAFLAPITIGENSTILMGHIKNFFIDHYAIYVTYLIMVTSIVTIFGTVMGFIKKNFKNEFLNELFVASPLAGFIRIGGACMFMAVALNKGPAALLDENTGGMMAGDLLPSLMITFFVGVILMPLLTSFGLVEFIGTLIAPFMRKVFKVPGYAAVDALASFVGDGTIGIVVTDQQYAKGYYTQRQAAIIATSFSIVGISFAAVVADMLNFSSIFWIFYMTIALSTVIAGFIIARLPLKKFKDEHCTDPIIEDMSDRSLTHAFEVASQVAGKAQPGFLIKDSLMKIASIYLTFIPVIMFVGTLGLIIAEHTSFFNIIATPLVPILKLVGFTHETAKQMAPAMIVGFTDMYLPALFIENCTSDLARFTIGTLAFAQLIFMSETGMILVRSKIGFNFFDTVKFFVLRTIITLPVILGVGYILVFTGVLNR
jgi:nucleoside recognition membrane protein YjiH